MVLPLKITTAPRFFNSLLYDFNSKGIIPDAASLPCRSEWYEASAEALPIAAEAVDLLVSQFAFMLFPDKDQAAREMHRVLAPGGALYVSAWRHFSHQPNYAALIDGIGRLESAEAAESPRAANRDRGEGQTLHEWQASLQSSCA